MRSMISSEKRRYRLLGIFAVFSVGLIVLLLRLLYVYHWYSSDCSTLSEKNYTKFAEIKPTRGSLVDVQGRPLATNEMLFDLYWRLPEGKQYQKQDYEKEIEKLVLIGVEHLSLAQLMKAAEQKQKILLQSNLSFECFLSLSEKIAGMDTIQIVPRTERIYPYRSMASHLLGYVQKKEEEFEGVSGLERILQTELEGVPGQTKQHVNARGRVMREEQTEQARSGKEVRLTIDLDLQRIVEKVFTFDQTGAVVIVDPYDGAIKALVSYPNFDPNRFLHPLSSQEWEADFQQKSPLLNRATQGLYPPASLFKLVTFAAGLEEGLITTDTLFECKGHHLYCGRKYYCQRHWGHGILNAQDALAYSCNIPCYLIAEELDIDVLAWYAREMGLGSKTGLFLPERSGLIPTKAWKQSVKQESWWRGETLSASIGQSFIMVTPLQVACMLGAIFTGYRVRPRILVEESIEKYPTVLSDSTRFFLQESMALGVQKGTSRRLSFYNQFTIFAKTGTAQVSNLRTKKEKCMRSQFEHGWSALYFSYKNQEPYVLVVLVEHAGSARVAVEVAQKILRLYGEAMTAKKA